MTDEIRASPEFSIIPIGFFVLFRLFFLKDSALPYKFKVVLDGVEESSSAFDVDELIVVDG